MLMQLDGTAIILAISFIIFSAIMKAIFYTPVTEVRKERKNFIETNINNAKKNEEDAQNLIVDYDQKIKNSQKESGQIVSTALEKAKKQKTQVIKNAYDDSNFLQKQNNEQLKQEKFEAIEQLKPEVITLAHEISKKILGKEVPISVSSEVIERAING
ncbi:MAG: F0F1 ATP synthase subunit B [Candidatus Gastranaerophilales bacterium]|nr:F0F1 ATP synthase subunit B [Candidatus Gastranaerophilales bacterium]